MALALGGFLAPPAQAQVLRTPGYKGVDRAPGTRPAPPPRPVVLSEAGRSPDVAVDAAGTAHIVWSEPGAGTDPDVTRYCRLKRAATSCDNPPASQRLVPPQAVPEFNDETTPPRVLAVGDDLAILSFRYPNVTEKPDGTFSSRSTYLWTSDDGGTTIGGPALVGEAETSGVPAVFGTPDAPRIGVISDTQTGGTFFQAISPGRYTSAMANLAGPDPNRAYSGSLAVVGGLPVAAFADLGDRTWMRAWTGQGDVHDASTWAEGPSVLGSEPRLASGPAGLFLLTASEDRRSYVVRRVDGGRLGRPVRVTDTDGAAGRDFFQDPGGGLWVGWSEGGARSRLFLRGSRDGARWTTTQTLGATTAATGGLWSLDLGAAFDGGGFGVFVRGGTGSGAVLAAPFGNQQPTGRLGLGSLAGGGADPDTVSTCQRLSFGDVRVVARQGCFLTALTGPRGTKVSEGPVRINGIDIIPDPGVRILINPRLRTLDTTGRATVQLTSSSTEPIVIFRGKLEIKIPARGASLAQSGGRAPSYLFGLDTSKFPFSVKGFPVKGEAGVEISPDGSSKIPLALELQPLFGGVTIDVELKATNRDGLKLDSLKMKAKKIPIGPVILIEDVQLKYESEGDKWSSSINLVLPPVPAGPKVGGSVTFKGGKFSEGRVVAGAPFPGIKLAPGVFLVRYGGGFGVDPFSLTATALIGALPIAPPSSYTVGIDGTIKLSFGIPFSYELKGDGTLFEAKVQEAYMRANTDGFVGAGGKVELDLEVVSVKGELEAFIDAGNNFRFGGRVLGETCVAGLCLLRNEAVLSSRGVGACVTGGLTGGFGYRWGDPITEVKLMAFTCDLSEYTVPPPTARAAQAGGTFTVAAGTGVIGVRVRSGSGSPAVALVAPSGERIVPVDAAAAGPDARAVVMTVPDGPAFVAVRDPAPGAWRIEALPGSPAITEVAQARDLPAPQVSAQVRGRGRARTLTYRATAREGLTTTFVEQGAGVGNVLGQARGARGALRFTPATGRPGRRTIVAVVEQDGLPRLRETVAAYRAPAPARPARVRSVRVRRAGGGVVVRWTRARGATAYAVRARLSDGRTLYEVVRSRVTRIRFVGVPRGTRARVTVSPRDASGRAGRSGRGRL